MTKVTKAARMFMLMECTSSIQGLLKTKIFLLELCCHILDDKELKCIIYDVDLLILKLKKIERTINNK